MTPPERPRTGRKKGDSAVRLSPEKLATMIEMQSQGYNHTAISQAVGFSRVTVYKRLRKFNADVLKRARDNADARLGEQLQKLELAVSQAFRAWENSKKDQITRKIEGPVILEEIHKSRDGDPDYLRVIILGLAEIRKLLGLEPERAVNPLVDDYVLDLDITPPDPAAPAPARALPPPEPE